MIVSLSGEARLPVSGRRWGAAAVYALALAVALAQLVASWAWASGAHVTVEQVALHEEAVAHGHADHHGGHVHDHGSHHVTSEALGPVFAPAPDLAGLYQDVLHGALVGRPDLLTRVVGHRLDPRDGLSPAQHFSPVPHRPPITP
jgi:hypothetical protein